MNAGAWALSAAACVALLLGAWVARVQLRSWLAPSAFFGLYWSVALLFPLVLAPDFHMWPGGPWFIFFLWCALHVGVLVGFRDAVNAAPDAGRESRSYQLRGGAPFLVLATMGGVATAVLLITGLGIPLTSVLLQPRLIAEIGRQYAGLRYTFEENPPLILSVLNGLLYLAGCAAGVWFAVERSARLRLLGVVPILLAGLQAFLVNARTGFFWFIIFVVSTYLAGVVLLRQDVRFASIRRATQGALLLGGFVTLFAVLQVIREGVPVGEDDTWVLKTRVSTLAPPMSFSHWLRNDWDEADPAWGARTLGGVFDQLGLADRRPGLGWEDDLEITATDTNVYTAFRQLVEDFTLPGAIVAFLVLGAIMGTAFRGVVNGKATWLPVLAIFYAVTLGSYLANWMNYNSCLLGWFAFFIIVGAPKPLGLLRERPAGAGPPASS